jgi:hypothetical protein
LVTIKPHSVHFGQLKLLPTLLYLQALLHPAMIKDGRPKEDGKDEQAKPARPASKKIKYNACDQKAAEKDGRPQPGELAALFVELKRALPQAFNLPL